MLYTRSRPANNKGKEEKEYAIYANALSANPLLLASLGATYSPISPLLLL